MRTGAINLPLRDITQNLDQIPKNRLVLLSNCNGRYGSPNARIR